MSQAFIDEIKKNLPNIKTKKELDKLKLELSKKYRLPQNLSNIDLLSNIKVEEVDLKLLFLLLLHQISCESIASPWHVQLLYAMKGHARS